MCIRDSMGEMAETVTMEPSGIGARKSAELYQKAQHRQEQQAIQAQKLKLLKLERELRQMKPTPAINQYPGMQPRDINTFAEAQNNWMAARDKQVQEAAAQQRAAEAEAIGKLDLPSKKRSEQLLEKRGEYSGPVSGWKERQNRQKKPEGPSHKFKPQINPMSEMLQRAEPVHERLFKMAEEKRTQEGSKPDEVDPTTGQRLYQPLINSSRPSSARSSRHGESVGTRLYEEGCRKEQEKQQVLEQQRSKPTATPRIDANSDRLARQLVRMPLHTLSLIHI
eukprot:TRINITY_DN15726_c0_g2_i2.p1 TRINITY_DN15726_c0_g2~~TRINITY_DN15726_c0_g2_i2.p1  ORF type:complete len:280 (-),score=100.99 TRINITY_DN15726_c0_g2_i2:97-936(-)